MPVNGTMCARRPLPCVAGRSRGAEPKAKRRPPKGPPFLVTALVASRSERKIQGGATTVSVVAWSDEAGEIDTDPVLVGQFSSKSSLQQQGILADADRADVGHLANRQDTDLLRRFADTRRTLAGRAGVQINLTVQGRAKAHTGVGRIDIVRCTRLVWPLCH